MSNDSGSATLDELDDFEGESSAGVDVVDDLEEPEQEPGDVETEPEPETEEERLAELLETFGEVRVMDQARLMLDNQRVLNEATRQQRRINEYNWRKQRAIDKQSGLDFAAGDEPAPDESEEDMELRLNSPNTTTHHHHHYPPEPPPTPVEPVPEPNTQPLAEPSAPANRLGDVAKLLMASGVLAGGLGTPIGLGLAAYSAWKGDSPAAVVPEFTDTDTTSKTRIGTLEELQGLIEQ